MPNMAELILAIMIAITSVGALALLALVALNVFLHLASRTLGNEFGGHGV
jgi:hypothetical protein